eukprot:scaffold6685_cov202-Prasinococcus_capsulatus_cf.AAC.9
MATRGVIVEGLCEQVTLGQLSVLPEVASFAGSVGAPVLARISRRARLGPCARTTAGTAPRRAPFKASPNLSTAGGRPSAAQCGASHRIASHRIAAHHRADG